MALHPATLEKAIDLIEKFEGIEEEAYLDPVGIATICAGLTRYPGGRPVRMGDVCSKSVCRAHLHEMLKKEFIPELECIPGWDNLGAARQAVLISFAWNLGAKFYNSTGFETISLVLRDGAQRPDIYRRLPDALNLYVKAGGKTLPGLVNRRHSEGEIWKQEGDASMKLTATQETVLKKAPISAGYLSDTGKQPCSIGKVVAVSRLEEIPADSHAWVTLEGGSERWAIYLPHWREESAKPAAAKPKTIDWSNFGCSVGRYLTVGEILQYDARRKPVVGSPEEKALLVIAGEFDAIRESWKGPLGVTSGYRPEPINRQVGGVSGSYHTKGMALDIYPIGESLESFHQWLIQRWSGGYGDGRHKGFIHIDTRNSGRFSERAGVKPITVWSY